MQKRKIYSVCFLALIVASLLCAVELYKLRQDHKASQKEYADYAERAAKAVSAFTGNVKTLHNATNSLPNCSARSPTLDNRDFAPAIPYFVSQDETQATIYTLKRDALPKGVTPLFFMPDISLDAIPVKKIEQQPDFSFSLSYKKLGKEIRAYGFSIYALENNKPCVIKAQIHSARMPKTPPHIPLKIFGRVGMEWGRFSLPYGTDIDQDRNTIIISDCINGLIKETDFSGNLIRIIGENGDNPEQMSRPADVKIAGDKIYVIEEENHRYQVFNRHGDFISAHGQHKKLALKNRDDDGLLFTKGEEPFFNNPLGIALDKDHNIFVSDYNNYRIVKLSPEGTVLHIFGWKDAYDELPLDGPYYIDIDKDSERVYVVDRGNDRIVVFDTSGKFLFSFGEKGTANAQFDYPHEIEITSDGRIFIADIQNRRVQIFDLDGNFLDVMEMGAGYGLPKTVAVSEEGFVITGHVGNDAYMVVWKDPHAPKDTQSLLKTLHAVKAPSDIVIKLSHPQEQEQGPKAAKGTRTGEGIYKQVCASCHNDGSMGAPKAKNETDWKRFPRDINVLLALAKQGKGAMLPKGGCDGCTDEELLDAIRYMLPGGWNKTNDKNKQ